MFDKATKRSRGFGFITYDDPRVCQHLLEMGQQGLDATVDPARLTSGYIEMRGKTIELKRAEPKQSQPSAEQPKRYRQHHSVPAFRGRPPMSSSPSFQHHGHNGADTGQDARGSYELAPASMRYPVAPYGFPPVTPMHYYGATPTDPSTPQAALDLAHHMLFYSQLLATPTLMSPHPMVSPMTSPAAMGYEPQSYSEYFQPYQDPNNKDPPPRSPIPPTKKKVTPGQAFQLGGATFIPETPSSPKQDKTPGDENDDDPPAGST